MPKTFKTFADLEVSLWQYFEVEIKISDKILGGTPKDPNVIDGWLNTVISDEHQMRKLAAETKEAMKPNEDEEKLKETLSEANWCGFKRDENGLFIEGRTVKAMLKETANILKNKLDLTAFKARVAERVFVLEDRVYLDTQTPDGDIEKPIHVMTAQGPRTSLKRTDYVSSPTIKCTLEAFDEPLLTKKKDKIVPQAYLEGILQFAMENGLGAERSQGYGRFEIVRFEKVELDPDEVKRRKSPLVEMTKNNQVAKQETVTL